MKDPIAFYLIAPLLLITLQVLIILVLYKSVYGVLMFFKDDKPSELTRETGLEARKTIVAQETERAELTKRKLLAIAEFEELTNDKE